MIEKVNKAGGQMTEDGRLLFPRDLVQRAIGKARRVYLCGQIPA